MGSDEDCGCKQGRRDQDQKCETLAEFQTNTSEYDRGPTHGQESGRYGEESCRQPWRATSDGRGCPSHRSENETESAVDEQEEPDHSLPQGEQTSGENRSNNHPCASH